MTIPLELRSSCGKTRDVLWLAAILSLLTGIAGWFYIFYSRAAHRLSGVEEIAINHRRVFLRRVGGGVMLVLAIMFYLGFYAVDAEIRPVLFLGIWLSIFCLIVLLLTFALIDLRLTLRLKNRRFRGSSVDERPPP